MKSFLGTLQAFVNAVISQITTSKLALGGAIILLTTGSVLGLTFGYPGIQGRLLSGTFRGLPLLGGGYAEFLSPEELDQFLSRQVRNGVKSPLYGLGRVIVQECLKPEYKGKIDPALIVAIAGTESSYGLAYLNTPYWDCHNPFGWLSEGHGSAPKKFPSWEEGIRELVRYLWEGYISPNAWFREGGKYAGGGSEPGYVIPKDADPVTIEMIGRVYCVNATAPGGWIETTTRIYRDQLGATYHLGGKGGRIRVRKGGGGTRETICNLAKAQIGKPYSLYSCHPPDSFNCSVLVEWVYAQVGIRVKAPSYNQWDDIGYDGKEDNDPSVPISLDRLQPGDVVFFVGSMGSWSNPGHVGIYVGNDYFVHAANSIRGVVMDRLSLRRDVVGARSFLGPEADMTSFSSGIEDFELDEELPDWMIALLKAGISANEYLADMVPPTEGTPLYPLDERARTCGHWTTDSQDLPFFGAPRAGGAERNCGVDVYPPRGEGTPVRAIKGGRVLKVAPFCTLPNGETVYGVLVDHGEFVVHYAEIRGHENNWGGNGLPAPGDTVAKGQVLGYIGSSQRLHFELYTQGTTDPARWSGNGRPKSLLDPTKLLQRLYRGG